MLAYTLSGAVSGINGYVVKVEVDVSAGLPSLSIVGLPDTAIKESRDRVTAAVRNSGFDFPMRRVTINLAPADVKKEGAAFDLPMAVGTISSTGEIKKDKIDRYLMLGELSLDGSIREVRGILPIAIKAKEEKFDGLILPVGNRAEAAVVTGLKIIPVSTLKQTVQFLQGEIQIQPYELNLDKVFTESGTYEIDFRDVKGQTYAKRALEVAAAGAHNVLMIGPPGSGKTMLAKRLATILPPLELTEATETTKIHSVAGMVPRHSALVAVRPFRSPHHTISDVALIGGGTYPRPGEVSLAHNGVLFLDELPEFHRDVLEVLRQPIEDGTVTISRATMTLTYPARFTLVCAMNPCPCGYFGHPLRECTCNPFQVQKYLNRVSGPLMDRIDIHIEVPALKVTELSDETTDVCDSSVQIANRVIETRQIQQDRFKHVVTGRNETKVYANSHMTSKLIKQFCEIDKEGKALLRNAIERLGLSARAYDRILKVARTIADLEKQEKIAPAHLAEAIQYRTLDRNLFT